MTPPSPSRRLAAPAAALLLLGALVFLFVKTEVASQKGAMQAASLLRELRDLDARWDQETHRLASDLSGRPALPADPNAVFSRILQEMEQAEVHEVLGPLAGTLRAGVAEKHKAFRMVQQRHAQSLAAMQAARQSLQELAAAVPAARARNPRAAAPLADIAVNAERLLGALRASDIEAAADLGSSVESSIATLAPAARATDPDLVAVAGRVEDAVRQFVRAREEEGEAWRRFAYQPVGPRAQLAATDLARSVESALDDKDRWRTYLAAYAAALLIGVAYLVTRLVAADAALRRANQDLEKRVAERTRDLSEALRKLKESEAQLVQTEKMSSLGFLVAGVAHEINTPLAYVKSNLASARAHVPGLRDTIAAASSLVELLRSDSPDPEALARAYGTLAAALERLSREAVIDELDTLSRDGVHGIDQIVDLVSNLKNFARLDRSKIASYNVNESVTAAFLIARPLLRKIDVQKRLGDVPPITCSPSQVNQVVLNLVTNAAQAIDKPRGSIVATTRAEGDSAIAIEIADNGRGIAPDHLQRIFDPFFTTKEVGRGTGLGLSIAYKIVAQHGGRIDVRSQVGEGTTFTVVLPVVPPRELQADEERPQDAAA